MPNEKLIETEESNYYIKGRGIPMGCDLCLKGFKSVLFLNGICQKPDKCSWYCPLSEKRKNKEITYINEIKTSKKIEIINEIKKSGSKGMSITGGEPLFGTNIEKTIRYIKLVKNEFGNSFHIHLYTNGIDFNQRIGEALSEAGLDEIRFHPATNKWSNIKKAMNMGINVGAEVPVIPNPKYLQNLKKFILYLDRSGGEFINLNEFEYCFPNSQSLKEKGYSLEEGSIASVKNSRKMALEILKELYSETSLKMHFCSIRAKDYYQLKNRYYHRAQNIKKSYEEVSKEGLLIYGQIEGDKEILRDLFDELRYESKIPSKYIKLKDNMIELPYYIMVDENFLEFFAQFDLRGYIIEALPFRRSDYRQITEKTPLDIFLNEFQDYEN